VVDRLVALARRLEHDREVLFELALADELGERPRAQTGFDDLFGVGRDARIGELVTHGGHPAT
jgi:predicted transcriptional regulator